MEKILCPGCGENMPVEEPALGNRFDCRNCANVTLKVVLKNGQRALEQVHKVSCPRCDRAIEVPEGMKAGDTITCCGQKFTLTYAFGAFALIR